jgi:hypothetical protein
MGCVCFLVVLTFTRCRGSIMGTEWVRIKLGVIRVI